MILLAKTANTLADHAPDISRAASRGDPVTFSSQDNPSCLASNAV